MTEPREDLQSRFELRADPVVTQLLSNEQYHRAWQGVSSTQLRTIARGTVLDLLVDMANPKPSTPDQIVGSAVHKLVLEPGDWTDEFAPLDGPQVPANALDTVPDLKAWIRTYNEGVEKDDRLGLGGNKPDLIERIHSVDPSVPIADAIVSEFGRRYAGKLVVPSSAVDDVRAMADAVLSVEDERRERGMVAWLDGVREQSMAWTDEETGLRCKIRPDCLHELGVATDLKTTGGVSERFLTKMIIKQGWDVQAAFYMDGIAAVTGQMPEAWCWCFVQATAPYHVRWTHVAPTSWFIHRGRRLYRNALRELAAYLDGSLETPGYPITTTELEPPRWVVAEEEQYL